MLNIVKTIATCGGKLLTVNHDSVVNKCVMTFNIYLPRQYYSNNHTRAIPTVYYLSGLTCTPNNASEKAFWQVQADKYGFVIVFPDTSPRGDNIPDSKDEYDFGLGAGFYVNATETPYNANYNMFDYVHTELPNLLNKELGNDNKIDFLDNIAITGHSMGGMGALVGYLSNGNKYKSCSAFSPIVNPSADTCAWGKKSFDRYLNNKNFERYDPLLLMKNYISKDNMNDILISVGTSDQFFDVIGTNYLNIEKVDKNDKDNYMLNGSYWDGKVVVKREIGFDHSYYFISSFVAEHAEFHAKNLKLI